MPLEHGRGCVDEVFASLRPRPRILHHLDDAILLAEILEL